MLGYHREPLTQDEAIRDVWYNHSEWGRRRKQKIAAFWIGIAIISAVVSIVLLLAQ